MALNDRCWATLEPVADQRGFEARLGGPAHLKPLLLALPVAERVRSLHEGSRGRHRICVPVGASVDGIHVLFAGAYERKNMGRNSHCLSI